MAVIFRPPYPFTFDTSSQSGNPRVVSRGAAERGERDVFLRSNDASPSSASIISAFGMDAGQPVDDRGRRLTGRSQLFVDPSFDFFGTYFWAGALFNSVHSEATVNVFVEEFDPSGNFVRGIDGPSLEIFRAGGWWLNATVIGTPSLFSAAISGPDPPEIPTRDRFNYRVWIDLRSRIQAAGWGFGGSGAIAQVVLRVLEVNTHFDVA